MQANFNLEIVTKGLCGSRVLHFEKVNEIVHLQACVQHWIDISRVHHFVMEETNRMFEIFVRILSGCQRRFL
jgi:hypothetical protein